MKSAYKYELADAAGVSYTTFYRWIARNRSELEKFGVTPKTKLLPPNAVKWICNQYGIDWPAAA